MRVIKEHGYLFFLLLVSSLLRFLPLFEYQFTFDELSGLDRTQFSSYTSLLEKGVKIDAHPALIQIYIYLVVKFFGFSSVAIKLLFLVCAQLAIVYAYLIGNKFFSKQVGSVAATFLSFSLIFVFYAPIARMYIVGVWFSLACIYYLFDCIYSEKASWKAALLFALFAWLSALNHHINALFAFTLAVTGILLVPKNLRIKFIIACVFCAIAYLPHLSITLYQLSVPGIGVSAGGWLSAPSWHAGIDFVKVLLGTGYSFYVVVILIVLSLVNYYRINNSKIVLLFVLFLINYAIVHLYSLFRSPIFQNSVMLFSGTALIMAVSVLLSSNKPVLNRITLTVLCSVLLLQTYVRKDYLHQAVKTVYDYQFEKTLSYKQHFGDANVYPVFFDCDTLMRTIYFKKYKCKFDFKMSGDTIVNSGIRSYVPHTMALPLQDTLVSTLRLFSQFVNNCKANYFVLSSAPPLYQALVQEQYPYLIENTQTQAINFKVYARLKSATVNNDVITYQSTLQEPHNTHYPPVNFPFRCDSTVEFPMEWTVPYSLAAQHEGEYMITMAEISSPKPFSNQLELIMSVNDTISNQSLSYSGKSAGDYFYGGNGHLTVYADQYVGVDFERIKRNSILKCFFWNRGKHHFVIHKIRNFTVDYWPQKWQWWN